MSPEQMATFLEDLPTPDGFDWLVTGFDAYARGLEAGLPTFYGEYSSDSGTTMVYLVGQHQLAGTVQR